MILRELITQFGFEVDNATLDSYDKIIGKIYDKGENLNQNLNKLSKRLTLGLTVPIGAMAGVAIAARAKLEDLQKDWEVLLGSQEAGNKFVNQMMTMEEKSPFETEQIAAYAHEMKAMGVAADQILPKIQKYMDISAGRGIDMGGLVYRMQFIKNMGYIMGRDLRYFIRSGILTQAQVEKLTGVRGRHVYQVADKGRISSDMVEKLMDETAKKYAGAAARRADTLGKAGKNLWHSIFLLRAEIGRIIENGFHLKSLLKFVTGAVEKLTELIHKQPKLLKGLELAIGSVLFVAGPALKFILMLKTVPGIMLAIGRAGLMAMVQLAPLMVWAAGITAALWGLRLLLDDMTMYFKHGSGASFYGPVYDMLGLGTLGSSHKAGMGGKDEAVANEARNKKTHWWNPIGTFQKGLFSMPSPSGSSVNINSLNVTVPFLGEGASAKSYGKSIGDAILSHVVKGLNNQIVTALPGTP